MNTFNTYLTVLCTMEKHQKSIQPVDYIWYKNLTRKQKQLLASDSKPQEIYRNPPPIEGLNFSQEGFINITVEQTQSFYLRSTTQSIKLATYREQSALKNIKALVILFHGLNSHIQEGVFVATRLSEAGYEVVGFDQRGFGKSQGRRGYMGNFNINMGDAQLFISEIRQLYNGLPMYLCGISMGGLFSFNLALRHPEYFKGLILMAPALKSYYGSIPIYATQLLSFIYPFLRLPKGNFARPNSKNPNVNEGLQQDPYRYEGSPYSNTLKCVLQEMRQSQSHLKLLIIQGARDHTVDPDGAIELYEQCRCKDKQILYYPNLWHCIWQEEEIYDIMPRVIEWLDKQPK